MSQNKPKSDGSVHEVIIAVQAVMLFLVGLAGYMATDPVHRGFDALRDRDSAVAIVTDKGITTDKVDVDLRMVEKIIQNYELVCYVACAIGLIVLAGVLGRTYKRMYGKTKDIRRRR